MDVKEKKSKKINFGATGFCIIMGYILLKFEEITGINSRLIGLIIGLIIAVVGIGIPCLVKWVHKKIIKKKGN